MNEATAGGDGAMAHERQPIWCCACDAVVQARLTNGAEIYPNRQDLDHIPFWKCDGCKGHVGTHHKVRKHPTKPIGFIPTPELRDARQKIHAMMDPLFLSGRFKRSQLYARISLEFGREYHAAELRNLEEAREVWRIVKAIAAEPGTGSKENQSDGRA